MIEFGQQNADVIMLLHGGGLSWWNYREQKSIRDSVKMLHEVIPGSSLEILPGLRHGDLCINRPEQYAKILTEWIGETV